VVAFPSQKIKQINHDTQRVAFPQKKVKDRERKKKGNPHRTCELSNSLKRHE
jgi:hypothetical protein